MDPVVIFDLAANYYFCQGCFSLNFAKHCDFFERREIFANLEKNAFLPNVPDRVTLTSETIAYKGTSSLNSFYLQHPDSRPVKLIPFYELPVTRLNFGLRKPNLKERLNRVCL